MAFATGAIGSGRVLALDGHMDVVDAGDPAKWQTPPFAATHRAGRIYGRGATDMKAGLAALTLAFQAAAHAGLDYELRFYATVGEEIDNYGARQLLAAGVAKDIDALVIGEPTNGHLSTSERGIIDYTVTATGKAAHSSTPEKGANAIHGLLVWAQLALAATAPLTAREDPQLGHATHNIDLIEGGNQINSIPEAATLRGNIRTTPTAPNEAFIQALTEAAANVTTPGVAVTFHPDSVLAAVTSPATNRLVTRLQASAQQQAAPVPPVVGETGITDAAVLYHSGMALAIYGPGNGTSHQTDEYVEVADYLAFIDRYQYLLDQW